MYEDEAYESWKLVQRSWDGVLYFCLKLNVTYPSETHYRNIKYRMHQSRSLYAFHLIAVKPLLRDRRNRHLKVYYTCSQTFLFILLTQEKKNMDRRKSKRSSKGLFLILIKKNVRIGAQEFFFLSHWRMLWFIQQYIRLEYGRQPANLAYPVILLASRYEYQSTRYEYFPPLVSNRLAIIETQLVIVYLYIKPS